MNKRAERETLAAAITAHLPAFEQRVRKQELAAVVAEALRRDDVSPTGFLRLASEYEQRTSARRARLQSLRAAYEQAHTPAEHTEVLAEALREEKAPRRAFAALRRGWLDLDAMAERAEVELHELAVRQALALRAAAALTRVETAPQVMTSLVELLLGPLTPMNAIAVAEALTELLTRVPSQWVPEDRWELVCALLREPGPRRVQAALARLSLQAAPRLALDYLGERLRRDEAGDDFLMRQHFVVLLGQRGQDAAAFALLAEQVRRGERSEHVRLAWPTALLETGGAAATPILEELAGAGPAARADSSPRVRGAAVLALAELLRRQQADTTFVLARLLAEPEPLVYQLVVEQIEALALQHKLSAESAATLSNELGRRPAPLPGKLIEPTMRAREALAALGPALAAARAELVPRLRELPLGASLSVTTQVAPLTFGRLLAQLAGDGFGYYAQPIAGGYRVERGARFVRRAWRLLHELRMHSPYKRQDALHTIGRQFYGQLRAPSGLLAEATNTAVPGEPLASPSDGTWGPQLPTVDDLLSMPLWSAKPVLIFSSRGLTELVPPRRIRARLHARLSLSARYAELAEQRLRSLDPLDPSDKTRYAESLAALGFELTHRPYDELTLQSDVPVLPPPGPGLGAAGPLAPGALALLGSPGDFASLGHYLLSPAENTFGQLGFAVMVVGALMLASNLRQRARIRRDRAAIPLCIGGWGTRGKSGTERLKAAMLHAQDVNVLVKTTGCEAMFIHGVPGRKPTEIFIHRSYDKATIWEQRDLLALAARLSADVFLWECMALSGPLVSVLSEEWMRDDLQTLTNAYPDHEDIQGPAGHDVARSIAGFMRSRGTVITSEEQMLPVLADEARRKKTRLIPLGSRDHLLLADDLLARFPYREHPRNVALVRRLAVELGLDPDLATADMADHVIPDLGVLKVYPTVTHRSRRLTFINGMSANDRTGFLSNWQRTGCERPIGDQSGQPGRWVVTVVNNRYDRVARSKAFAEIIVRDASAERHILIGTNLAGLRVYVAEALVHLLRELHLFRSDDAPEAVSDLLRSRSERLRHRLRIGAAQSAAVLAELSSWVGGQDVSALAPEVEAALAAAAGWADGHDSLAMLRDKLAAMELGPKLQHLQPGLGPELAHHLERSIARRALLASLFRDADRALGEPTARAAVNARQERLGRELFLELLVPVEDAGASGDQVIDAIASACPPGVEASVMGMQNIKGTGLDFVYRWIRYDEVNALVERLAGADASQARQVAGALVARTDFGMLDSALAADAVAAAASRLAAAEGADYLTRSAARLREVADRCQQALKAGQRKQRKLLTRTVEKALDTLDEVRRRWQAESLLDALVHHEISHERAALEARRLVEREKKGWLRKAGQ